MEKQKFYLVAADALPEVFLRVAEAKRMLQVGEAATVGDAARQVGISRSAFYKYKDAVQPFQNMHAGHIITFYALLKDNPGVLSNYLAIFANSGANIQGYYYGNFATAQEAADAFWAEAQQIWAKYEAK